MGVSIGAGLAKAAIFTAHWEQPATIFGIPLLCLLLFLMLRGLYRGRRWAFWLIVPLTAFGVYHTPATLSRMASSTDRMMFTGQAILQGTAVLCLLLSPSRRWFFAR